MVDGWAADFADREQARDFIACVFEMNPNNRSTARELEAHPFFDDVREIYQSMMGG